MEKSSTYEFLNRERIVLQQKLTLITEELSKVKGEKLKTKRYEAKIISNKIEIIKKVQANISVTGNFNYQNEEAIDPFILMLSESAKDYQTMMSMCFLLTAYYDAEEYIKETTEKRFLMTSYDFLKILGGLQKNLQDYFEEMCALVGKDPKKPVNLLTKPSFDENYQMILNAFSFVYERSLKIKITQMIQNRKENILKREKN